MGLHHGFPFIKCSIQIFLVKSRGFTVLYNWVVEHIKNKGTVFIITVYIPL